MAQTPPLPGVALPTDLLERYAQVTTLADQGRCQEAMALLGRLESDRETKPLPAPAATRVAGGTAYMRAVCAASAADYPAALKHMRGATKLAPDRSDFWLVRAELEASQNAPEEALVSLEESARLDPANAKAFNEQAVYALNRAFRRSGKDDYRLRLLEVLDAVGWSAESPFASGDQLRLQHAQLLLARGDREAASGVAGRIQDVRVRLVMDLDAELRTLGVGVSGSQARAVAERELERGRELAAAHPRLLEGVRRVATDLLNLGRPAEGLNLLDSALARVAQKGTAQPAFTDADEQVRWARNTRADLLEALGRFDEAEAELRNAAALTEDGQANVSQTINLASFQVALARGEAALATLSKLGSPRNASPYGVMWIASNRACAHAQAGRSAQRDAALRYVKEHAADNPAALTRALLCVGDEDGAARAFIGRLVDPLQRADALLALSRFQKPAHQAPYSAELERRNDRVRARRDVQAAVARVGRTTHISLLGVR